MPVRLGPFPLCPDCQLANGGPTHTRHRPVHLQAPGQAACVDAGIAGLARELWAVCRTTGSCENDDGRAYVTPTAETAEAAAGRLAACGYVGEADERWRVCFQPDEKKPDS